MYLKRLRFILILNFETNKTKNSTYIILALWSRVYKSNEDAKVGGFNMKIINKTIKIIRFLLILSLKIN